MSETPARGSERVLGHIYPQSDHGAASEVDDRVDCDHFQVQLYVPRPFDGACHHQGGTDGARLPHIEFSALIPRLDLENVISPRVAGRRLHLEDVSRNGASRYHIHIPVQDGKGLVSAARILSGTHTAVIADPKIRLLTADGVNALEAPLQIVASLLQVTRVVSVLALVDILATPVVIQQNVTGGTGAEVRAGLIHTLMLAEELREAAFVHVTAMNTVILKLISWVTAADERAIGVDTSLHAWVLSCTFVHILARPSILIEGKTGVAGAGIGSRNVRTQLLAVAIATFINV